MGNLKKILLITALLAVTIGLAFLLYYFFQKTGPLATLPPTGGVATTTPGGALPPSGVRTATSGPGGAGAGQLPLAGNVPTVQPSYYQPEAVTQLTSRYTADTSLNASGQMRYYNQNDGKFYRLLADNTSQAMSDQVFYNVQKVTWASGKDKAVLEYPDSSKIIYNFETQKQYTLPKHWQDFSFSPDSSSIAAKSIGLSPENRWLVTVKDDGTGTQLISGLGENADKVIVDWSPSQQAVGFSLTGQAAEGLYRQEILLVGLHGENFKSFIAEGMKFQPQWSTTGKKLLYSVTSDRTALKPELWIVDAYGNQIGANRKSLEINTWADKCAFADDNTVYCAIPQSLPDGAGLKPEIADNTYDSLYRIDLRTGAKTAIPLDGNYTANTISYDGANKRLLFTDKNQTGIFEVKI